MQNPRRLIPNTLLFFCLLAISACGTRDNAPNTPDAVMAPPPAMSVEAPIVEEVAEAPALGNIVFNTPEAMIVDVMSVIEVRLSKHEISEAQLIGDGPVQKETIIVTANMSVRLCCGDSAKGDAFDIRSSSSETQSVNGEMGPDDYTEWVFQVTPRVSGEHYLQLFVSTLQLTESGQEISRDRVLKRRIKVSVNQNQQLTKWLKAHWQWLGLMLVIPLAAYIISRRLKVTRKAVTLSGDESIFISYRRDDSSGYTLAIYEKLKSALGDEHVFMDMDDIPHGENFEKHIERVLSKANTVLVMIGQHWLSASNEKGRRLDDPEDFVRMEVATALNNQLRVIPVLLRGAEVPERESLPDALQELAMRNAIRIHDDQFDESIARLIKSISQ